MKDHILYSQSARFPAEWCSQISKCCVILSDSSSCALFDGGSMFSSHLIWEKQVCKSALGDFKMMKRIRKKNIYSSYVKICLFFFFFLWVLLISCEIQPVTAHVVLVKWFVVCGFNYHQNFRLYQLLTDSTQWMLLIANNKKGCMPHLNPGNCALSSVLVSVHLC